MAKVSLRNVSKIYPDGKKREAVVAVNNVTIEIADREFVVLLGPSGCGKSTTLRMIAGLEEISRGEVWIGDRRMNDVAPKDRDIAMVFQNYALYPHMTVYDNLAFGLKLRKYSRNEIQKRVADAASVLGLDQLLDRKPKALSGGERQRVAVGRAIVRQPKVFLFDEPFSNLDARLRAQMRVEIMKLHQRLQATMIYVTHDQVEAMTMGDRIVVMNDGVVQQTDTPLVLYHEPANLFVAGFLGSPSMNFVHGKVKEERGTFTFSELDEGSLEVRFPIADRPSLKAFAGKEATMGLRPETIEVAEFAQPEGEGVRFKAIVDLVEPMGAETILHLQTGAHTLICRSQAPLDHRDAGRRMNFVIDPKKAHFFDPVSTKRVLE